MAIISGPQHVCNVTRDLGPSTIEREHEVYKKRDPFLLATAQPLDQNSLVKEAKIEALRSIAKSHPLFKLVNYLLLVSEVDSL